MRRAVRTLFAAAVRPGPPSRADTSALLSPAEAVERLNRTAAAAPVRPVLSWPDGAAPTLTWAAEVDDARLRLTAGLARKDHPRQEWCKPSCGNRARVARHYQRHNADR
ncbi:CGNR zinc finger domain-containing protein [Micromonospora sp. NPDC006766]|uniref:CGNR zinc finger domain-containing protein n=1 Tax=Micromonospora sp. NPDC006766 TaxID=3154778 RepID=UPI0033C54902